ncbi:MAG TPA: extracellular solute-binding protein [Candidatus Ornithomonoglobus intestinigallinarum]|uniref:Extracellular solute-binding protein n=1 Tax=Candidatus Ornithomonoglobus intestinigallinarum TaxID=2840894 RepID=A0A9D1KPB0_9FIRM|nr:extracellular solute-binding protein [Candidatus Ornithomonoglobus intestinigallinarum]
MKFKKLISAALAAAAAAALAAGCSQDTENTGETTSSSSGGKVQISVGAWPSQNSNETLYNQYMDMKARFEEANPDIEIIPDNWSFSLDTFMAKAAGGALPTLYEGYYTEANRIIDAGYCADLTEYVEKYGYDTKIKEQLMSLVSKDGKYYAIPKSGYTMGLYLNKNMLEAAGEVNEDGSIKVPDTYQELAEMAGRIREKTGQAGIAVCTANGTGGWNFLNIAWSFGTKFMEQDENGKWIATFDSPECVAALQYIKDLKWKYNALLESSFITGTEQQKFFSADQAAMFIGTPPQDELVKLYGMSNEDICIASLPKGDGGRYAQIGGTISFVNSNATPEQIDACFKWIEFANWGYAIDDAAKTAMEEQYQVRAEQGLPIGFYQYSPWTDDTERSEFEKSVIDANANIPAENVESFNNPPEDLQTKPEEPMKCQELYTVLDSCIQEVITNENADPAALIKNAQETFQKDYLDSAE